MMMMHAAACARKIRFVVCSICSTYCSHRLASRACTSSFFTLEVSMSSSTILKLLPFGISAAGVGLAYVYINKDKLLTASNETKPLYEENRVADLPKGGKNSLG